MKADFWVSNQPIRELGPLAGVHQLIRLWVCWVSLANQRDGSVLVIAPTDRRGERLSPRLRRRARRYVPLDSSPFLRPRSTASGLLISGQRPSRTPPSWSPTPTSCKKSTKKLDTTFMASLARQAAQQQGAPRCCSRCPHTKPRRRTRSPESIPRDFERRLSRQPRSPVDAISSLFYPLLWVLKKLSKLPCCESKGLGAMYI